MQQPEQIRERSVQANMEKSQEVAAQIAQLAEEVVIEIFRKSGNPHLTEQKIEAAAREMVTPEFILEKFPGSSIQPADVVSKVGFLAISTDRRPELFAKSQAEAVTQ